jgi:ABC-2 type transport system permease protein
MMRLLRNELLKLFARKRTYIGFGAFLVLEVLFVLLLQLPASQRSFRRMLESQGAAFDEYFSAVTMAVLVLAFSTVLRSIYIALVAGDIVAKEAEDGTLRMMLCRPVSRPRLILAKAGACFIYTAVFILFIGVTTLLAGRCVRPHGSLFVMERMESVFGIFDPGEALVRYALGIGLLALVSQTIAALAFMFSCFNIKPAAATVLSLSVLLVDLVLRTTRYFESLEPYWISKHMMCWVHAFDQHPPWEQIAASLVYLVAFNLSCVLVGGLHFVQRDFKS